MMLLDPGVPSAQRWLLGVLRAQMKYSPGSGVPAPWNTYAMPLRFKLGGRPVLSARLNVETARSKRKWPEFRTSACLGIVFVIF